MAEKSEKVLDTAAIKAALVAKAADRPVVEEKKVIAAAQTANKNFAKEDIWLYHAVEKPRMFEKGEVIPEGWQLKNKWGWYRDSKRNFNWQK